MVLRIEKQQWLNCYALRSLISCLVKDLSWLSAAFAAGKKEDFQTFAQMPFFITNQPDMISNYYKIAIGDNLRKR
jgi:hypothetical protein